jgi:CRISPR type III-B/RAMP module RAMP protein Cmr6
MLAVTKPVEAALCKGCDAWQMHLDKLSLERGGDQTAKTASLKAARASYTERAVGHLAHVCRSRQRFLDALRRQHGSRFAVVELFADSRLLLHLGRASVLENVGICADRTTGLPFVPGTALKGVLSTWACWEANQAPDGSFRQGPSFVRQRQQFPMDLARRVFGDDSKEGSQHAGDVIFVGGFPATPPRLGLDIVNPHHEPDGRDRVNLTPNVFLCIEPDTKWQFAFYVRPGAPDAVNVLRTTAAWLTECLTQLGIGAKTAAGYGRFRKASETDKAAQAREAEKAKAAEAAAAEQARVAGEKAREQAVAHATLLSDYPNSATFRSRVTDKLNPGQLDQLQPEVSVLQKRENAAQWQEWKKLLASKDYKDIRRRLRDKPWFPKEWLPPQ